VEYGAGPAGRRKEAAQSISAPTAQQRHGHIRSGRRGSPGRDYPYFSAPAYDVDDQEEAAYRFRSLRGALLNAGFREAAPGVWEYGPDPAERIAA